MGSFSIWHWIIVLVVVLVLFGGRGKISQLMGDFAQGIKAFKKGMSEDDNTASSDPSKPDPKPIENTAKPAEPIKQHTHTVS
jgi:sec-independent protein translocase protein TatA